MVEVPIVSPSPAAYCHIGPYMASVLLTCLVFPAFHYPLHHLYLLAVLDSPPGFCYLSTF